MFARVSDHIALQTLLGRVSALGFQMVFPDEGLTLGTLLPTVLGTFVTPDVYIGGGEDFSHLVEHIVDEFVGFRVTGTEHIVGHAPELAHLVGAAGASQLGIGCQGRDHVSRQVDFGDYRDVSFRGVAHDVATLLLRVKSAVGTTVVTFGVMTDHGLRASAAHGGEARIALDLNAPALVVGQVPVEPVDVVERQQIDEAFHAVGCDEMARHIEFHAAIAEARCIAHAGGGNGDGGFSFLSLGKMGQCLAQRLNAVERTGIVVAFDANLLSVHLEPIAFASGLLVGGKGAHGDAGVSLRVADNGELPADALQYILLQEARVALLSRCLSFDDGSVSVYHEGRRTRLRGDFSRKGHNVEIGLLSRCRQEQKADRQEE